MEISNNSFEKRSKLTCLILRCRWRATAWPEGRGRCLRWPFRRGCRRAPPRYPGRAAASTGGCDRRSHPAGRWPRTGTRPWRPGTSAAAERLPAGCCPSAAGCRRWTSTTGTPTGSLPLPYTIRRIAFLRTPPPIACTHQLNQHRIFPIFSRIFQGFFKDSMGFLWNYQHRIFTIF